MTKTANLVYAVAVEVDHLTISITHMDPKYFYVNYYTVTCANARLTFNNEDMRRSLLRGSAPRKGSDIRGS